jgi:hypothetical protein
MNTNLMRYFFLLVLFLSCSCGGGRPSSSAVPVNDPPRERRFTLSVPGRSNASPSAAGFGKMAAIVWTASTAAQSDIYISVSEDGGNTFGAPARVNDLDGDARASGEQAARVAIGLGYVIHVAWPARIAGASVIRYARSTDAGRSFSKAVTVAGDKRSGARGWHALTLGHDGAVHVAWLDGRNAAPSGAKAGRARHTHGYAKPSGTMAAAPRQDVFHAAWKEGAPSERPVASHVCFCCKTALATSGDRVFAAWRHIYPGSIRDIAVARSTDNGVTFEKPVRVSDDGWRIAGCPDDGPSMVADGHGGIHLAWPTLVQGDTPRKAIFYSSLAEGGTFTPRLRLDSGESNPAHPQIASDEHTNTAVVWDERAAGRRRIVLRRVSDGVAAAPENFEDEGANYPAVAAAAGHWVVVWSAEGPEGTPIIAGRQLAFIDKQ